MALTGHQVQYVAVVLTAVVLASGAFLLTQARSSRASDTPQVMPMDWRKPHGMPGWQGRGDR